MARTMLACPWSMSEDDPREHVSPRRPAEARAKTDRSEAKAPIAAPPPAAARTRRARHCLLKRSSRSPHSNQRAYNNIHSYLTLTLRLGAGPYTYINWLRNGRPPFL